MNEQERQTPLMPDFWLIIRIHEDRVEVFSHARYSYIVQNSLLEDVKCIYTYTTQMNTPLLFEQDEKQLNPSLSERHCSWFVQNVYGQYIFSVLQPLAGLHFIPIL